MGKAPRARRAAAGVLAIFGISGDLAKKMTFRALYRLEAARQARDARSSASRSTSGTTSSCAPHARDVDRRHRRRARRGGLRPPRRAAHLRPGRLRRRRHLRAGEGGARRRREPGLLPGDPALAVRHRGQRARQGRPDRERPRRDREAVRPRPRLGPRSSTPNSARCWTRSRSSASTITSARSR